MRVIVCADDGDQIAIDADDVATEQAVIRLGLQNPTYNEASEFEGVNLTMAEAIERYHHQSWSEQIPRLMIRDSRVRADTRPAGR